MKQRIIGSYLKLKKTNIIANFFNLSSIQLSNVLLFLITVRIITGIVGIATFGIIMFANKVGQFVATIVNYGTNQSVIKDTASHLNDPEQLGLIFFTTIWLRAIIFSLAVLLLLCLHSLPIPYYSYIVLATPIVLAEVLNPLCFYIGVERLKIFNLINLVFNIIAVLFLIVFIKDPHDAGWVNFILGGMNVLTYLALLIYLMLKLKLPFQWPVKAQLQNLAINNFYLTVNSVSVNLQQSIIVFALANWSSAEILGAYSLCDRIIGQCRNLLITISNAIYPNTVHVYNRSKEQWNIYRKKMKYLITGLFSAAAIVMIMLANFIICPLLSAEHNDTAVLFLRIMALVPVASALNVMNVLDQLLKNNTVNIFKIAVMLFMLSIGVTLVSLIVRANVLFGSFTLIMELSALLMYEYVIKKPASHA